MLNWRSYSNIQIFKTLRMKYKSRVLSEFPDGTTQETTLAALMKSVLQGAPAAKTVSTQLTGVEVLNGLITVNQGGGAASALQLPTAVNLELAIATDNNYHLSDNQTTQPNDSFDFSLINISAVAAESASITTAAGWTLVGDMDVQANNAATTKSAGRFRARRTGVGAWTLYRIS